MTSAPRRAIGTGVAGLAAASIAVTLLGLAARSWWVAELFTHFRLQLVAGQLVLLAALLGLGYRRTALALAACAVLNGWSLYPVAWPAGQAVAVAAGNELSVMTVNVSARNDRHEPLLAMIEHEQPDLILVVELTERWARRLTSLDTDYPHRELLPDAGAFGLALLSRHRLEIISTAMLGASGAIDARVHGPSGPFRVLGVHLLPPTSARGAAERNRQLAELAERRALIDEPLIVLGDFNLSPYSPYYAEWLAATELEDTLAGRGPSATWPSFMPVLGIPIDHCFVSAHFTSLERRHLPEFGSDHYPVLVRLTAETNP